MLRDSCSKEQAESKVGAQMPLEEKRKLSDIVIDNNGSREELRSQVCLSHTQNVPKFFPTRIAAFMGAITMVASTLHDSNGMKIWVWFVQTVEVVRRIRRHGLLHQVFLGPGMVCVLVAGAFKFLASRH